MASADPTPRNPATAAAVATLAARPDGRLADNIVYFARALRKAGVRVLILSKERNPVVTARARKLGVDVLQGVEDKAPALAAWAASGGIDLSATVYVGNDVNDIGCLDLVGWPVVVADAHPDVVSHARVVLERHGGYGAIRELADRMLRARR